MMKSRKFMRTAVLATSVLLLSACGANTMYNWEGYNYALLKHYKDGTSTAELADSLRKVVTKSEKTGAVPPGLYAEFGYALLNSAQTEEALVYFQKEHDKWPESRPFLDDVIRRISE